MADVFFSFLIITLVLKQASENGMHEKLTSPLVSSHSKRVSVVSEKSLNVLS